ncbi:MAG: hypothetical protein M0Z75_09030, partial [Nitrospiraceae bacterium]|nr:hypothetical protein [Nitrospiraceae bacterium]
FSRYLRCRFQFSPLIFTIIFSGIAHGKACFIEFEMSSLSTSPSGIAVSITPIPGIITKKRASHEALFFVNK